MKKMTTILLLIVFLLISSSIQAAIVEEILILGLSKTDKDVVRSQLPFSVGDKWEESYKKWTINRLSDMGIFSYRPKRIVTENISKDKLRIIIRLADPPLLYIDPAEYIFSNLSMLPANRFRQSIYNYSGNGERILFDINWNKNYFYKIGGTYPFKKGLARLNIKSYRKERETYLEKGYKSEIDYNYWYNSKIFQQFKLTYQRGKFNYNTQEIILPSTSIFWEESFSMGTIIQSGFNITEKNQFFKTECVFHKRSLPWDILVRGGLLSNNTPSNHFYYLGGAGELPLRAEKDKKKAASYLLGSIEYRFEVKSPLTPIIFADGAVFKKDLDEENNSIYNIGLGITYNTPLDIPIRFDFGYNPENGNNSFRFAFGNSSWFNRIK